MGSEQSQQPTTSAGRNVHCKDVAKKNEAEVEEHDNRLTRRKTATAAAVREDDKREGVHVFMGDYAFKTFTNCCQVIMVSFFCLVVAVVVCLFLYFSNSNPYFPRHV